MRWLAERLIRADRDRGASVVLVAILVVGGFLGIGAFVVDVGGYYAVRAQTQNGADAAALAVARECSLTNCSSASTVAAPYAEANSNDNFDTTTVSSWSPCGDTAAGLPACPAGVEGAGNPSICPASPGKNYVDVQVRTQNGVPAFFSRFFGNTSQMVGACAQAQWGIPSLGGGVLALTFAECSWNMATNGGADYAASPPAVPGASAEQYLALHVASDAADMSCQPATGIGPLPGGFGWTPPNNPNAPCSIVIDPSLDGWYLSDTGNGSSTGTQCEDKGNTPGVIPCAWNPVVTSPPYWNGTVNGCPDPATPSPLLIPIYDKVCTFSGSGATATNEVQLVTISNATGGTFTLSFTAPSGGAAQTTAPLAYNSPAVTVQAALETLPGIGTGSVSVSLKNSTYTVTFQGALANQAIPVMTADGSGLKGSKNKTASVTVTEQTSGSPGTTCPSILSCPQGNSCSFFHLATLAAFVVTGYSGSSFNHNQSSWLTGKSNCPGINGGSGCLMGYFVKDTTGSGDIGNCTPGDPTCDTGVRVVKLTG